MAKLETYSPTALGHGAGPLQGRWVLDSTFDTDGKLTTSFNSYGDLTAIYVQPDGKLLAIGSGDNGADSDIVMARYNDNGALDSTFDTDGKLFIDPGGSEGAYKAARQEDGRWLILGYSGELYRLERDGAIDTSFGTSGVVTLTAGVTHAGVTWARGNAYIVGYDGSGATYDFAVSAYHAGLSERLYYQQDANHNITSITDESGAVLERFVYTPYGQRTVLAANFTGTSDAYGLLQGHQGGRYDALTGLYNFRMRDYDPSMGTWMEADPIGYPDGVNRYQGLGANPLAFTDVSGLSTITIRVDNHPSDAELESGKRSIPGGTLLLGDGDGLKWKFFQADGGKLYYLSEFAETIRMRSSIKNIWEGYKMENYATLTFTDEDTHIRNSWDEAIEYYRCHREESLRKVQDLADSIASGLDSFVHLVPGSSLILDLPEAVSGKSMTNAGKKLSNGERVSSALSPGLLMLGAGASIVSRWIRDTQTKSTKLWSAACKSEGEARQIARQKLGTNPVKIAPGKWRSADGKWQYRAKPGDVVENHVHLEELNPQTGEVIQNLHLRWPEGTER